MSPSIEYFGALNLPGNGTLEITLKQSTNIGNLIRFMIESEENRNVVDGFVKKIPKTKAEELRG